MSIDALNLPPSDIPIEKDAPVSTEERALIMGKLINQLMSLEEVQTKEVKPIVEALRVERDRKIAPLFHSLDGLVELSHQHPDEKKAIDTLISDTADLVLGDVTAIQKTERKAEIGIHVVWTALHAWDKVRSEATDKLATELLDNFWGAGKDQLKSAKWKAEKEGIPFSQALDEVNRSYAA